MFTYKKDFVERLTVRLLEKEIYLYCIYNNNSIFLSQVGLNLQLKKIIKPNKQLLNKLNV